MIGFTSAIQVRQEAGSFSAASGNHAASSQQTVK
jgi:hypothetical protein